MDTQDISGKVPGRLSGFDLGWQLVYLISQDGSFFKNTSTCGSWQEIFSVRSVKLKVLKEISNIQNYY
jgi:hypothetical protein